MRIPMLSFNIRTAVLSLFVTLLLMVSALVQANESSPDAVIQNSYESILQLIKDKKLVAGMPVEELHALMDAELGPVVDFPRVARKIMAKYSRQASDQQLENFTLAFKRTLVNTYAKGLEHIDRLDKMEVLDTIIDKRGVRAKVATNVGLSSGEIYRVDYSLYLNDDKQWKVENIVVEGINIGITFRNQFASQMEQFGDMDAVIQNWGS